MDGGVGDETRFFEDKSNVDEHSCKKCAKLVLPHVTLVVVVCLYTIAGAWIFYSLESPHEDKLKSIGIRKIGQLRSALIQTLWMKRKELKRTEMDSWARVTDVKLQIFKEYLYKAFKEHYIKQRWKMTSKTKRNKEVRYRYADIHIFKTNVDKRSTNTKVRRRKSKELIRSKKLWTASSAVFFAATTMATIGYGNIVPVTLYGRIACVIFALFGVPLAIITIGNLGKFLSECTIWFYTRTSKSHSSLKRYFINLKLRTAHNPKSEKASETRKQPLNWDDVLDKTEVPLVIVLAILLFYMAFGGIILASFGPWTYTDAFYFCFVSLTTIGFGDLVPENQECVLLMLAYLGFGLAVTTMCIDLVGIQYIQKIHYFGRKFRGTEILQLLKRQAIKRGLAADRSDEFLELFLKELQEAGSALAGEPEWHLCSDATDMAVLSNCDISAISDDSNNSGLQSAFYEEVGSKQSFDKSSANQTAVAKPAAEPPKRIAGENCCKQSLSIERLSVTSSCEPLPNPKLKASDSPILTISQSSLPSHALPLLQPQSPETNSPLVSPLSSPTGLTCIMECVSYAPTSNETKKPSVKPENGTAQNFPNNSTLITSQSESSHEEDVSHNVSKSPQSSLSTLSSSGCSTQIIRPSKLDLNTFDLVEPVGSTSKALPEEPIAYCQNIPIHSLHQKTVETENALQNMLDAPESIIGHKLPPAVVDNNYCFVIDGETIGSEAMLQDDIHWSHTSRPTQYFYSDDLRSFHRVNCIKAKGKIIAVKIIGLQTQALNALHSARSTPTRQSRSIDSISPRSISTISGFSRDTISLMQVYVVTRIYSFWKTCPSFRRIVTLLNRVNENEAENIRFQKRIFVQYIWRSTKQSEKERVKYEFRRDCARLRRSKINKTSAKLVFK
ncbi:unnamed protein product [Litomosoides sigmodontis]|uniref:Potassium channel domain-containing protein n=1 Tax=Litomosoides sigmodontis TaxID=42156 RepID=A0A3P6SQI2_LITSI|nr:unnamed protein product [Litomosoides sigmodontis]